MTGRERHTLERRVLTLGPSGKDAELLQSVLADAGVQCICCTSSPELLREMEAGVGALLVTEEVVNDGARHDLVDFVQKQPAWSELPVLILMARGNGSPAVAHLMETLGNVTLIERPLRIAMLVSAVRTALRARERQYQIRAYIAERESSERALREADRRKDEFLAALAHELRNPLAPIRNALRLLRHFEPANPQAQWAREVIDRQARHLTRLVDDLLDVSRITRGKIILRKEPVELDAVVRSAVETSRPLLEGARHRFSVKLPGRKVQLEADPVRLAQALSNLLNNAAKYTPEGGRIELSAELEEGCVTIRVSDTGIGISAEKLERIFDLFVQDDHGLPRSQGGLGIGLTLVQSFVQLHGGTVTARSAGPGQGSEFTVRLPVSTGGNAAAPASKAPEETPVVVACKHRILIVDDNEDGARSLSLVLQMNGNEVRTVYDGPEALEAVSEFRPDVVLLDIGLPTLNGYETARRIRQLPGGRSILIIALTGWGQEEHRRRSREAGFDHHLVKPVDLAVLMPLLAARRPTA